ncbi:MAG: twin-arginine translocase subunit TatC, partial [Pseudomonadota bacterium]|nr:twin-arginine translocase subunit TatC [Pseudomonadota bacterium]
GGLGFQLPVALTLMVRSGLVSTKFLKRNRKFAVLILFILSGVLTPPDIISQAMLGGPMYLLYEAAIFIGGRIETYQRANNPYWADDSADDENENDNENQIFDAASDEDDDDVGSVASESAAEAAKPKILKTTPKPSGDEGLLKPDPDDD